MSIGDKIIIVNYGLLDEEEIKNHKEEIIVVEDEKNLVYREI